MKFFSMAGAAIACIFSVCGLANASPDASPRTAGLLELSLAQAVKLAVDRSYRTARARRNEEVSELRYGNARSAYYPRVNFGFSADQTRRGDRFTPDARDGDFRAGLGGSVSLPVDVGGVIRRQADQADAQRTIARHEVDHVTLDIALEAQNNYLNALRAQSNVRADEHVVAQIEGLLERSRSAAPGVVPFLKVELGNARQSLTNSRASADQAQDGLKQTLRIPLDARLHLNTDLTSRTLPIERGDLLRRALVARPDVQQAQARVRQAELSRQQVSDHRRPSVSIGGRYRQDLTSRSILDGDRRRVSEHGFGLNLNVPIAQYDHGQLSRHKRIARNQRDQAVADASELSERVEYDLHQASAAVERAENRTQNLPDTQQAFEALQRAEQQMLAAAEGQEQSLLAQVSNARNAWRSAQTASADAFIDYNRAVFRLQRTLGETEVIDPEAKAISASTPIVESVRQ